MGVAVQELFLLPFSHRTLEDQVRIVKEGPAKIDISSDEQNVNLDDFQELVYSKAPWIVACAQSKSFFCWPCLLFNETECVWSKQGVNYGGFLTVRILTHETILAHETSVEHIQAELDLKLFFGQNVQSLNLEMEKNVNESLEVAKNLRESLKVLIDAVSTCVAKKKAPTERENCNPPIKPEECLGVLNLIRNYDTRIIKETGDAIDLVNQSPKVISDLTDAMTSALKSEIKREIRMSTYVALILSEHSEVVDRSLISTVLRYLKDGKICERFVGFTNACDSRLSCTVFNHISGILNEFDASDKFISYSIDGGVLPLGELSCLIQLIKANYPKSFFVPWYCHLLDYVLQQSLTSIKECRCFFRSMTAIKHYFCKSPRRYKCLNSFMCEKRPELNENPNWFNGSSLSTYRKEYIAYFEHILSNSKKWDADDIAYAFGFCQFLQDPQTVFMLRVFTAISDLMSSFQSVLKGDLPDNIFATYHHDILKRDLRSLRDSILDHILSTFAAEFSTPLPYLRIGFQDLLQNIINISIDAVELRFDHLNRLEFCHMLNRDKYVEKFTYRTYYVMKLVEADGTFSRQVVNNELDILQVNARAIPCETIEDLFDFFTKSDMQEVLPSLFKVAEFRLTLPIKKGDASKHKDITKFSYLPQNMVPAGDASVLCVESNFFQDLRKSETFNDEVIIAYNELNDDLKLM